MTMVNSGLKGLTGTGPTSLDKDNFRSTFISVYKEPLRWVLLVLRTSNVLKYKIPILHKSVGAR